MPTHTRARPLLLILLALGLLGVMPVAARAQAGDTPAARAGAADGIDGLLVELVRRERERVVPWADRLLMEPPVTITAMQCERSSGGRHDFYSEGDYWWPDPDDPDGPYIQRDGMTNPDAFYAHRQYMMRLSLQVPALTAAYLLTDDQRYARHAVEHLRAWFVDEQTRMAPHLLYAQAIQGRTPGRGIGIIDTIHLIEVARSAELLMDRGVLAGDTAAGVRAWFADYLVWMTSHPNGRDEAAKRNNHATCFTMQVLAFARVAQDQQWVAWGRDRFEQAHIGRQMSDDGSFPEELGRTKPYGYSLFNLDATATVAELLAMGGADGWGFATEDGRGMAEGIGYMAPYIRDKSSWPLDPDIMYGEHWPMRHPALLFAALRLNRADLLELYLSLPAESSVFEVNRNFFIRQPLLWLTDRSRPAPQR